MNTATRAFLWLAGFVVGLLVLGLIGLMVATQQSKSSLEKYRAELVQRGEPLNVEPLIPPKAPATGNGAPALMAASRELKETINATKARLITIGQKETSGGSEVMHRRPMAAQGSTDLSWAEAAAILAPMQGPLAAIRRAAQEPVLAVDLNYGSSFSINLDSVTFLLAATQYLSMDAMVRLQQGDTTGAVLDIEASLRLQRVTGDQPLLFSQLISATVVSLGQISTWEILQADNVTATDLERLQKAWESVRPTRLFAHTLRMERAQAGPMFDQAAQTFRAAGSSSSSSGAATTTTLSEVRDGALFAAWALVFRHADERQLLENYQDLLDDLSPDQSQEWAKPLATMQRIEQSMADAGMGRLFSKMIVPTLVTSVERFAATEALRDLTITAIALRRYQLDHAGALPPTLEAMVPQYLAAVPRDPIDGKPLRYLPEGDRFLLYSIGLDATDSHGDTGPLPNRKARAIWQRLDIVWPQPVPVTKEP